MKLSKVVPPMKYTRRAFVLYGMGAAACWSARRLVAQGVATHRAKPLARPAPSGRLFHAQFADVAADAGLQDPLGDGRRESKNYILERARRGGRFLDFDNGA